MIVDPAGEYRRFHSRRPRLGKRLHPGVEVVACCCHFALLVNLSARILDAETDALLVYIQSDVMHMSFEEPPWLWSESTWPLSSALSTPRAPLGLSIQTANFLQFTYLDDVDAAWRASATTAATLGLGCLAVLLLISFSIAGSIFPRLRSLVSRMKGIAFNTKELSQFADLVDAPGDVQIEEIGRYRRDFSERNA